MPRKRKSENKDLPSRWRVLRGAYYYAVPPGMEHHWDGKQLFKLGDDLPDAYEEWSKRAIFKPQAKTIGDILDRYLLEVSPNKAPATFIRDKQLISTVRKYFGHVLIGDLLPVDIYQFYEARKKKNTEGKFVTGGPTTAKHEIALLSHAYTKAVEWGFINRHPFKGEVRIAGNKPRIRYIEDWEIDECLSLRPMRKEGSVNTIQAYIELKLLTGLRRTDLLQLRFDDITEDGILLTTSKTGKPVLYEWSDTLRDVVGRAKAARPTDLGDTLFCTKEGKSYINDKNGQAYGWDSMWHRFMARVLKETKVTERFTEHDLRAKCASDAGSLEHARQLLSHADSKTTNRIYRRKAERVRPAK